MSMEERLKKLAEQAKDKAVKSKDDKQKERLIRWAKLKKEAPDTAEFVEAMSKGIWQATKAWDSVQREGVDKICITTQHLDSSAN